MCIDHRGRHVLVSEELLHGPNVVPVFKKLGLRRNETCGNWPAWDSSLASGFFDGLLNDGFMQVMSVLFAGSIRVPFSSPRARGNQGHTRA